MASHASPPSAELFQAALDALQKIVGQTGDVAHCEIMANPCLKPGIEGMTGAVVDKKLNRVIVASGDHPFQFRQRNTAHDSS